MANESFKGKRIQDFSSQTEFQTNLTLSCSWLRHLCVLRCCIFRIAPWPSRVDTLSDFKSG